jgi:hypothetical protein
MKQSERNRLAARKASRVLETLQNTAQRPHESDRREKRLLARSNSFSVAPAGYADVNRVIELFSPTLT